MKKIILLSLIIFLSCAIEKNNIVNTKKDVFKLKNEDFKLFSVTEMIPYDTSEWKKNYYSEYNYQYYIIKNDTNMIKSYILTPIGKDSIEIEIKTNKIK